jgi:sialate O-acetylesterase
MQWSVAQSGNADAEIMAAEWPQLRIYSMPLNVATDPTHLALGDWAVCTPDSIADYSAVAYYFGRELHQKLDVPVGLILIAWGGTPAEAWTSHETLSSNPALRILDDRYRQYLEQHPDIVTAYQNASSRYEELNGVGEMMGKASDRSPPSAYAMSARYRYYLSKLRIAGESQLPYGPAHFRSPSSLFNGMLCPAAPYKVRGVVWYQGESNVGEPNIYRRLLPAMIKDWRSLWGDVGLPFGIVQLANVGPVQVDPDEESSWADVRDVQRVVAHELANIGLIVTIDIGDEELVHAPNKQEVGRRLALWSMAKVYNEDNYYSGPVPIDAIIEGSTVILTFDHTEGGLVTSDSQAISGFTLAGNDGIYHWASATIQADDKLTISSPNVHRPTIVRYRWAENPIGNLTNNSGLPATPFQLDLMK